MLRARRLRLIRLRPGLVLGTNLVVAGAALGWILHRFGVPALAILATRPSPPRLAAFAAVVAVVFVVAAARWRLVLAGLAVRVALGPLVAYRAAGQSVGTLVPSGKLGGDPLRAYLLVRDGVATPDAIASVAVDRALDLGASAPFACLFAALLVQRGVPALEGALVSVTLGAAAIVVGLLLATRRLRAGAGLVTSIAHSTGLARLGVVERQLGTIAAAEAEAARLVVQPGRMAWGFAVGVAVNLIVCAEYWCLLSAFGLPAAPLAVVAAIFGTGAAHAMPVPAGVGVLEGGQMFLMGALGYPPEVGLAVGLAVRLRELVWVLPGLVYLAARGLTGSLARAAG